MYYYKVKSSHWPMELEFKSAIKMDKGQCFRITSHDGFRDYPTRFKVLEVSDSPSFAGRIVEIKTADMMVEQFE